MNVVLKDPYITIKSGDDFLYGGNQKRSPREEIRTDGCGVIAACDMLSYLKGRIFFEKETYNARIDKLNKRYFPFRKNHGMSGLVLAAGVNLYMLRHPQMPCGRKTAVWGVPLEKRFQVIEEMLSENLPVIMSVGGDLPFFRPKVNNSKNNDGIKNSKCSENSESSESSKSGLTLYKRQKDGRMIAAKSTSGHYMVITGKSDKWIRVSSWGEKYYINCREYMAYAKNQSFFLFTNILQLR